MEGGKKTQIPIGAEIMMLLQSLCTFMQLKPIKSWPDCCQLEEWGWCHVAVHVVRSVWQGQLVQCLLQSLCGCEQIQYLLLMSCWTVAAAGCMELCSWDTERLPSFLLFCCVASRLWCTICAFLCHCKLRCRLWKGLCHRPPFCMEYSYDRMNFKTVWIPL